LAWLIGSGVQIGIYAGLIEQYMGISLDVSVLRAGYIPWIIGIIAAIGLFVSVTLHELGHSWVALRYGLEIESITLWILGGIAALTEIPREWNREFWIAIAGPITSVLTGVAFYLALLAVPGSAPVTAFVLGWLTVVNVTLAVFNLLPAFPMDGGRILRALLARRRPYATATRIAGRIGVIFAFVFAIGGVLPTGSPEALTTIAEETVQRRALTGFASAIVGGALVSLLSFLLQSASTVGSRIAMAYLVGVLLALGPFDHVIVTALHVVFGMFAGAPIGYGALTETILVVTAGNVVGGIGLVTLTHVAQAVGARE
jgi:Zn-dependent protease